MSTVVIDLYDSGILISDGDRILAWGASCALIESATSIRTGKAVEHQACVRPQDICTQFWSRLSGHSSTRHVVAHAEIALHHLQAVWGQLDRPDHTAILAVCGTLGKQDLGLVLGICEKLSIPVQGIVNRAVLGVPGPVLGCTLVWLDMLQQHTVLTEMNQDLTGVSVPRPEILLPQGLQALNHTLAKRVAGVFIARTRFDPLQKAENEQQLREKLPHWLETLESAKFVVCALHAAGQAYRVRLERNDVLEINRPVFEAIASRLGSLVHDRDAIGIVCAPSCRQVFGLKAFLDGLPGCAVLSTSPVHMAVQALRYRDQIDSQDTSVHYTTSLTWDRETCPQTLEINAGSLDTLDNRPTHLLIGGHAWPLNQEVCLSARNAAPGLTLDPACDETSLCRISRFGWMIEVRSLHEHVVRLNGEPLGAPRSVQSGDHLRIDGYRDVIRFIQVHEHETPLV